VVRNSGSPNLGVQHLVKPKSVGGKVRKERNGSTGNELAVKPSGRPRRGWMGQGGMVDKRRLRSI